MSWRHPSNRSSRPAAPSGPAKTYFLSTSTIGRARRRASSASFARLASFSWASRSVRAASHSSRDTTRGLSISFFSSSGPCLPGASKIGHPVPATTFRRCRHRPAGKVGRRSIRTWLYRIATNRSLNALRSARRRPQTDWPPPGLNPPEPTRLGEVAWLEPYPDSLLGGLADRAPGPEARYEATEAISLASWVHSGLTYKL